MGAKAEDPAGEPQDGGAKRDLIAHLYEVEGEEVTKKRPARVGVHNVGAASSSHTWVDFLDLLPTELQPGASLLPGANTYTLKISSGIVKVTVRMHSRSFYAKPISADIAAIYLSPRGLHCDSQEG